MTAPVELVPVVILAGGKSKPEMVAATGVSNRALFSIGGRTMLDRVVSAMKSSHYVGAVAVVGDVPGSEGCLSIEDHGGYVENIFAGLDAVGDAGHTLVATSDTPFLTVDALDDFLGRALALDADMVYPVVHVERCYERFPGLKRTAIRVRDGRLTGGNMVLARPSFMRTHRERIAEAYAARKSPLRLAAMVGGGTTLRLLGALTISPSLVGVAELERSVSRMLGGKARAVISDYAEIATDIDRPEDIAALRSIDFT